MKKSELKIPNAILTLAEKGIWPNEQLSSYQEGCNFIEDEVLVQKIAPDEKYIFFHTLSGFRTMADEIMFDEELWHEIGALNHIDVNKCLVIGDFGLGSDSPIIPFSLFKTLSSAGFISNLYCIWLQLTIKVQNKRERMKF